jgi:hypothetical protein
MKAILVTVMILMQILICISLYSISQNTMVFLQIEPSTIIRGMGYGFNGVADIWHQNPAVAWDNPALPSLHEGVAVSYSKTRWLWGSGIDDMYYNSGMLTLGYKGFGVTLPSYNDSGEIGNIIDYGEQEQTDEQGNVIGSFSASETAGCYSVSFNPLGYLRSTYEDRSELMDKFNFGIGFSCIDIVSDIGPGGGESEVNVPRVKTQIYDAGMIMSVRDKLADKLVGEASIGYKRFNLGNKYVTYINDAQKDPIGQNNVFGVGLGISLPTISFIPAEYGMANWAENLLTLRFLASQNSSKILSIEKSKGIEVGLLDTFYYRVGDYDDHEGHVEGNTEGYGVSLHYSDLFAIEYNHAEFPGGELVNTQESEDYMLMLNLMKLFGEK